MYVKFESISNSSSDMNKNTISYKFTGKNVLTLGLKHGLTTRPKENEIIVTVESVWDQLECLDAIKDNYMSRERAKMAYNYIIIYII